jgi:hypothetical protein
VTNHVHSGCNDKNSWCKEFQGDMSFTFLKDGKLEAILKDHTLTGTFDKYSRRYELTVKVGNE